MKPAAAIGALILLTSGSSDGRLDRTWRIESSRSRAQFAVRYMGLHEVRGVFTTVAGTLVRDDRNPEALRVEATIDASSVDTNNRERDDDLRGPNYLDVVRFPVITFVSTGAHVAPGGEVTVFGDLTLHGVTRAVALRMHIHRGAGARLLARGTTTLSRKDYGLMLNPMISDQLTITLLLELTESHS